MLPLSWPGVMSGCIMVFLLAMSSYVTPQLLGGPSGVMVGGMIAAQFQANNNWALGAALALVLSSITFLILLVAGRWVGVRADLHRGAGLADGPCAPRRFANVGIALSVYAAALYIFLYGPIVMIVFLSFNAPGSSAFRSAASRSTGT